MSRLTQKHYIFFIALAGVCFAIFSLSVGYYNLSFSDTVRVLLGLSTQDTQAAAIVLNIRLARVVAAIIIGSALAVSGAAYQGMFKNPLVSPDILGVSSGASTGAAIAIMSGYNMYTTQLFAFAFGFLAVGISYIVSLKSRLNQTIALVLCGTMIGSVCSSVVMMIKYIGDPTETLPAITFWLMGSLSKISLHSLAFASVPMAIGFVILFFMRWKLNILMLDDEEAKSLGINPEMNKLIVIVGSTLLSSAAVCLGGLIGWVGLMIPHIARFMFGSDYRYLIPASGVLGAIFLLAIDTASRSFFQAEIPIGILTSILGAPFFLFLILGKKQEH